VAIVGRPNVGKSTLLNRLVGSKLSITSDKPQTTRRRVTGIVTRADAQIVFVDTPGYQTEHPTTLNLAMNRSVVASLQDVNAIVWVVEALKFERRDAAMGKLLPQGVPAVLAINKTDTVEVKDRLLPYIDGLNRRHALAAIIPISATKGTQVDSLLDVIANLMPPGAPLYEPDEITTVSERDLAAELLREQLFRQLGEELPYAASVEIERFQQEGRVRRIHAAILVDRDGQKAIVIGKQGGKLKTIATRARQEMERLFGGSVFLEVWVKVRRGWADSAASLKRLGYDA
jgi:GTP-binding protein Era